LLLITQRALVQIQPPQPKNQSLTGRHSAAFSVSAFCGR
jgi:hypothetical protein